METQRVIVLLLISFLKMFETIKKSLRLKLLIYKRNKLFVISQCLVFIASYFIMSNRKYAYIK